MAKIHFTRMSNRPQCGANVVDRTGQRFGRLVVLERAGSRGTAATWLCLCDCGNQHIVSSNSLRGNYTKSCGCARKTGKNSRPFYKCRLSPGTAAKRSLLKTYRYAAKTRELAWQLSDDEFYTMVQESCHYCGCPPQAIKKVSRNGRFKFNGIDRVNNDLGYISENTVPCCGVCNHAKATMTAETFRSWIKQAFAHQSL